MQHPFFEPVCVWCLSILDRGTPDRTWPGGSDMLARYLLTITTLGPPSPRYLNVRNSLTLFGSEWDCIAYAHTTHLAISWERPNANSRAVCPRLALGLATPRHEALTRSLAATCSSKPEPLVACPDCLPLRYTATMLMRRASGPDVLCENVWAACSAQFGTPRVLPR